MYETKALSWISSAKTAFGVGEVPREGRRSCGRQKKGATKVADGAAPRTELASYIDIHGLEQGNLAGFVESHICNQKQMWGTGHHSLRSNEWDHWMCC